MEKNKPSRAQAERIYQWLNWEARLPTELAQKAAKWVEENATKKQVIYEMQRMYQLKEKKNLNIDTCFNSSVWEGFEHE